MRNDSPLSKMAKDMSGASPEQDGKKEAQNAEQQAEQETKDTFKKIRNTAHAAHTAGQVAKLSMVAIALKKLHDLLAYMISMVKAAVSKVVGFIGNIVSNISSFFSGVFSHIGAFCSAVGNIFHIGAAGGATLVTAGTVAVAATTTTFVNNQFDTARYDGIYDCAESVEEAMNGALADVGMDQQLLEHAQKTYAVFHEYGLSDGHIAGILGNWAVESGIDASTIEGIYDEHYNPQGPKHQSAMKDLHAYVVGPLTQAYSTTQYAGCTMKIGYLAGDGKRYPGMGLGQWTGPGAKDLLDCAKSVGYEWYDLDFQLAYTLSGRYLPDYFKQFAMQDFETNPEAASDHFLDEWERNRGNKVEERRNSARDWYAKIKSGIIKADSSYASSILQMAQKLGATATDNAVAEAKERCIDYCSINNSSIAEAAVAYAFPTYEESIGKGTDLYNEVFDSIFSSDAYRLSCDRSVATAVRWSGYDDDFPPGNCAMQYQYLEAQVAGSGSKKWKKIGEWQNLKESDLQPGDIFVAPGFHTMMYTGHDLIAKVHPTATADANTVSGSIGGGAVPQRGPACWNEVSRFHNWTQNTFHVYRNINPTRSNQYINAAASKKVPASTTGRGECEDAMTELKGTALGKKIAKEALAQVGQAMQCTTLVSNSLRRAGIPIATDYWPQEYLNIVPSLCKAKIIPYSPGVQPAAGDILVYGGAHIAVALGNGKAVHGNFGDGCGAWNPPCQTAIAGVVTSMTPTHVIHILSNKK